ncbi:MAG TPA: hypothetical protein VFW97_08430 [Acidimicrobiia bacterium]|nr:hypothetical protein [Acidimicrobiia bacterium]
MQQDSIIAARRPGRSVALVAATVLAIGMLALAVAGPAGASKGQDDGVTSAALSNTTISSAGPLTNIYLSNELNCQVDHVGDVDHEFFGDVPGACGTLIATGGTLYGPSVIPAGGSASPRTTYTEVSQSGVTGSGTAGDPFQVVTVVDAGTTGLRLTETDSYIVGTETYRTDVAISNSGGSSQNFILYRAGDCFLQGSDVGFGDLLPDGSVGCHASDDGGVTPGARIERWIPITGGSSAYEAGFSAVWAAIGSQTAFPNTCLCTDYIDNGAGLSWSGSVAPAGTATFSHFTVFSPTGVTGPFLTKTAASADAAAGAGDSYTITVNNPTGGDVSINTITDHLPDGFHYIAGTSSGATTTDPAVSGQDLTWTGPFNVPAGGTATLTFAVTVSTTPGTYTNSVDGTAAGQIVTGTGPTAPVTVSGAAALLLTPRFTG